MDIRINKEWLLSVSCSNTISRPISTIPLTKEILVLKLSPCSVDFYDQKSLSYMWQFENILFQHVSLILFDVIRNMPCLLNAAGFKNLLFLDISWGRPLTSLLLHQRVSENRNRWWHKQEMLLVFKINRTHGCPEPWINRIHRCPELKEIRAYVGACQKRCGHKK